MEYKEVLNFWFGEGDAPFDENAMKLWFEASPETDQIIKEKFLSFVSLAGEGNLSSWQETPDGMLANIVLLDQFSRNIYRGLSAAFRYDQLALALCKKGLARNDDQHLKPHHRLFFYMPLEHSENLEDQEESLFRFNQLSKEAPPNLAGFYDNLFQYAHVHFEIIARFGRFPYRNAVLGRLSTPEEIEWLSKEGVRFGQ